MNLFARVILVGGILTSPEYNWAQTQMFLLSKFSVFESAPGASANVPTGWEFGGGFKVGNTFGFTGSVSRSPGSAQLHDVNVQCHDLFLAACEGPPVGGSNIPWVGGEPGVTISESPITTVAIESQIRWRFNSRWHAVFGGGVHYSGMGADTMFSDKFAAAFPLATEGSAEYRALGLTGMFGIEYAAQDRVSLTLTSKKRFGKLKTDDEFVSSLGLPALFPRSVDLGFVLNF